MDFFDILKTILIAAVPTILISASNLWMNAKFKEWESRRDEADAAKNQRHAEEREWRESVTDHMADQDRRITLLLDAQSSMMRSDIIHKAHRYQEQGYASMEEKQALAAEHADYNKFCEENEIVNNFIEQLVAQTLALPLAKEV